MQGLLCLDWSAELLINLISFQTIQLINERQDASFICFTSSELSTIDKLSMEFNSVPIMRVASKAKIMLKPADPTRLESNSTRPCSTQQD